jgi:chromosome segregation protein
MTGGYNKANYSMSPAALEKKFKTLDDESKSIENSLNESRKELESTTNEFNESAGKQNERKLLLNKYREREIFNQKQLSIYEIDYNSFSSSAGVETKTDYDESSLNEKISKLNSKKDKLNLEINVARQTKAVSNSKVSDLDAKLTESRFQIDKYRDSVSTNENNKIKCESVLENAKSRIIDNYRMTLEHAAEVYVDELPMSENQARETIAKLRYELDKIGNINMEAASELEEKSARFNELTQQKDQLEKARNEIASIIKELDEKAKKDFSNAITKTNEELPKIFKYLFGGGECKVEYTDPDNIITSGIDVIATPPGKTSVYLNLLSGGEKTLVALSILFAILANKTFPLIILDEAEAALDPANVERFGSIVQKYSNNTQFLVITHRPGTMERCDTLYGTTMQTKGVTDVYPVSLVKAKKIVEQSETSKSAA